MKQNTPKTEKEHQESGCTDYLQHSADSCPVLRSASVETARASQRSETTKDFVVAQRDTAQRNHTQLTGYSREYHKGAMVGEKATPEQIRLWKSLGIIK